MSRGPIFTLFFKLFPPMEWDIIEQLKWCRGSIRAVRGECAHEVQINITFAFSNTQTHGLTLQSAWVNPDIIEHAWDDLVNRIDYFNNDDTRVYIAGHPFNLVSLLHVKFRGVCQ